MDINDKIIITWDNVEKNIYYSIKLCYNISGKRRDTMNDTICAISTSQGIGAIAIVRVSGEEAIKIVNKIFKGKDLTKVDSHTINYGHIVDHKEVVDEVLVSIMKGPKTFTTEDIVEINTHGGIAPTP